MPKRIILAIIIVISFRVFADEMQKEHVQQIYPIAETDTIILIESGGSFEQHVVFCDNVDPVQRYLRVVGGVKMPDRFAERGESLFRKAEYLIIDHLDSVQVFKDKYSLYFDGYNDQFERYAYMRVSTPVLQAGKLAIETSIQTKNFQTTKNGHFGMELQLYFLKEGRHPHEVYDAPDSVINFPFPVGDSKFKTIRKNIVLPQNIATILLRVGGTNYSGECWVEAPKLIRNKKQIVSIPFIQNEKGRDNDNYWVGVNLSSRSYPHWKLEFNDSVLFDDIVFDRASNIADFYLKMPQVSGQGKLKLTLLQNNNKASFPYMLHRLQLIEESKRDFEIVFVPKYISCGDTVGVLVEINKPNTSFDVSSSGSIKLMQKEYTFEKTGLHVINAIAISPDVNVPLVFSAGKESRTVHFKQIIIKEKDDVRLSSGDEIYIDKKQDQYDYFFKWYFKSRVGNFYQFRPSYQWSGFRIVDEKIIGHYTNLLNQLHVPYAWQVEGRTLAGSRINPSLKFLQTPLFRGKQAHENDGAYYYWQHFKYEGLYSDIAARTRPYGGIFAKHRPIYTENGVFIHYDPYAVKDMADGANYFVSNLSYSRGESTRHTGPSTMFRYLYQAGYDWLGAEQMYGPENNIMSALRGASRAYYKKSFGSLHAVQWGSFPFTDPKHSKRFFMSLAVAYMHGSSHINTEEGLWTDEYANDRFTKAGKEHMYAQHQILDFIETHTRRGNLCAKIALLQGRNDAWKSYARGPIWSQEGKKWEFNKAAESFDLLKVFYPGNSHDASGPGRWFTSTPYGPIDILPIEADFDVMRTYDLMIFLGWNTFDEGDFEKLEKFIVNGGTLLLTAAHLNTELQPDMPVKLPENSQTISKLLENNYKQHKGKIIRNHGKGKIIYYPQNCYPIDDAIKIDYEKTMHDLAQEVTKKENLKGWILSSPNIDFTVWDQDLRRTIYVLNVNWDSEDNVQHASILLNNKKFSFEVPVYKIMTIHCSQKIGVLPLSNTSDVLDISENVNEWVITIQTTEPDDIYLFNGMNGERTCISLFSSGIHNLKFKKQII